MFLVYRVCSICLAVSCPPLGSDDAARWSGQWEDSWLAWLNLCGKMWLYWLRTQKVRQHKLCCWWSPARDTAICSTLPVWPWWSEMNQASDFTNFPAGLDPYHISAVEQVQIHVKILQILFKRNPDLILQQIHRPFYNMYSFYFNNLSVIWSLLVW